MRFLVANSAGAILRLGVCTKEKISRQALAGEAALPCPTGVARALVLAHGERAPAPYRVENGEIVEG